MNFCVIGVDYNSVSIEQREEVLHLRKNIVSFWKDAPVEAGILVTCNRFEIYVNSLNDISAQLGSFYEKFPSFLNSGYRYTGKVEVFRHALRLACGLESQIKGETQILEQINAWRKELPYNLAKVWDEAYLGAGSIRQLSSLNRKEDNIATFVYRDIEKYYQTKEKLKLVVIGTGKIAQLLAQYRTCSLYLSFAAHKNKFRSEELARLAHGEAISIRDLKEVLLEVDILISATSSPHIILSADDIQQIMSRRSRPLPIYDLALPRDISPNAAVIDNVILKNIDDLSLAFKEHQERICNELNLAQYLVEERVLEYETSFKTRQPLESLSLKAS